jgi:hypothetical protein
MSEVVESFPLKFKYPWETWADGRIHKCKRGEDFEQVPLAFAKTAYAWAARHDFELRASVDGDYVYLQFGHGPVRRKRGKPPGPPLLRSVEQRSA